MIGPDLSSAQRIAAGAVTQRASRILLARQDSAGRWTGRCAGDVTLDAESVLVREFLGVSTPELTRAGAQQIRSMQQPDGSWIGGAEPGGPGDLTASVLAYLALRLAGDSPDAYHLAVGAAWIRDAGGLAAAGLVAGSWLALFGLTGWDEVGVPAPEFIYLPARHTPAGGDWADLSRPAVVSLTVLGTLRPVRQLAVDLSELRRGRLAAGAGLAARPRPAAISVAQRAALRRCGRWLVGWQQRPGLPIGLRPYWVLSLVALAALGYPLRHPVVSGGLSWLDSVTARPRQLTAQASMPGGAAVSTAGQVRLSLMRQPPVRDTAAAVTALADAGLRADHPAMVAAGRWLLAQRITSPPEAAVPHAGAGPSGWSFGRDGYPVVADTAAVLLALRRIELLGMTGKAAVTAAIRWLVGAQRRDGSWGHTAGTTALVVQALAAHAADGLAAHAAHGKAIRHGVVWLVRAQLADGSWPGRLGAADLRTTADAVTALLAAGVLPGKPAIRAAVDWLLSRQNPDGGWNSGTALPGPVALPLAALVPERGAPAERKERHGPPQPVPSSDPAGTARAVAALLAAGGRLAGDVGDAAAAADAGAGWLMRTQRADGGWSDGIGAAGKPAGRNSARRRGSLLPGLLLPLAALGQYAAGPGAGSTSAAGARAGARAGAAAGAGATPAAGARAGDGIQPGTAAARTALADQDLTQASRLDPATSQNPFSLR